MGAKLARLDWLVLCLAVLLAMAHPAQAQAGGVIAGQVVNGTAGGPAVGAGLTVTLRVLQGETELTPLETTTDERGRFQFGNLDTDPALAYSPEVTYLEVVYPSSQSYSFAAGQTELSATVTVYETTGDDSSVRVDSVHMIAESFEQVLRISEVHVFGNTADRSFTGKVNDASNGQKVTVFIPLPGNAVGLAFPEGESSERFIQVARGIWDTQPVPPGADTAVVRFSYHLVVEGPLVPLVRSFAYPVSMLNVLVVQPGLTLRGDQLVAGEAMAFQGRDYQVYQVVDLGPDTELSMEFFPTAVSGAATTPAPTPGAEVSSRSAAQGQQGLLKWLGFGLAALAAVGAVAYPLLTRPRTRV